MIIFPTSLGRHHYHGPVVYLEYYIGFDEESNKNCYINLLKIEEPLYRGRGLGKAVTKRFIREMFEDPQVVSIELMAAPLPVTGEKSTPEFLKGFYGSLGFKLKGCLDHMILNREVLYPLEEQDAN